MIIEIDDKFIVPIPKLMNVVGFVTSGISDLAPKFKEDISRRLASANDGWNAVAIGAAGNPGLKLGARSEQAAIDGAIDDCGRQDRACHVVAIGPFLVEPKP
jgi:adenylate cyclase